MWVKSPLRLNDACPHAYSAAVCISFKRMGWCVSETCFRLVLDKAAISLPDDPLGKSAASQQPAASSQQRLTANGQHRHVGMFVSTHDTDGLIPGDDFCHSPPPPNRLRGGVGGVSAPKAYTLCAVLKLPPEFGCWKSACPSRKIPLWAAGRDAGVWRTGAC